MSSHGWIGAMGFCVVLAGCAAGVTGTEPPGDDPLATGTSEEALSRPGNWSLPRDVRLIGDRQHVAYDDAPAWDGGAHCSGVFLEGTRELADYLMEAFPHISSYGGYACRQNTADASKTSVHGTGRAVDIMIPMDHGAADNDKGDAVANWLVEHAEEIGVQYIIWDRTSWGGYRDPPKTQVYTGPVPHIDHIHLELDVEGAHRETPWFHRSPPRGRLLEAGCDTLRGWARDPDHPSTRLAVRVFFDGPVGDRDATHASLTADERWPDACGGTDPCLSGFEMETPGRLLDGARHTVRAYATDSDGVESVLLDGSPLTLRCDPPVADGTHARVSHDYPIAERLAIPRQL